MTMPRNPSMPVEMQSPAASADRGRDPVPSLREASGDRTPGIGRPGRRRMILTGVLIVLSLAALYLLLPKLAGLNKTWGRLQHGDPVWLAGAAGAEVLSIAGYILLFRTVFGRGMR